MGSCAVARAAGEKKKRREWDQPFAPLPLSLFGHFLRQSLSHLSGRLLPAAAFQIQAGEAGSEQGHGGWLGDGVIA